MFSYNSHWQIQGVNFKNVLDSSVWFDEEQRSSANWILGSLPEQTLGVWDFPALERVLN